MYAMTTRCEVCSELVPAAPPGGGTLLCGACAERLSRVIAPPATGLPGYVCTATAERVREVLNLLRSVVGLVVEVDWPAGSARVLDRGRIAYWALRRGRDGPWACRCVDTSRVRWVGDSPRPAAGD